MAFSHRLLALALASGCTVRDAAAQAGVSEQTAFRRLSRAKFRQLVEELRAQILSRAVGRLSELAAGKAVTVMEAILDKTDKETGELVANREDVKAVFDILIGVRNHTDLKAKLDAWEAEKEVKQ